MDGMNSLGIIENPLGQGRFAGIDVGTDTDVSDFGNIFFHGSFTFMRRYLFFDPVFGRGKLKNPASERRKPNEGLCAKPGLFETA
jgi:hypothetical protein